MSLSNDIPPSTSQNNRQLSVEEREQHGDLHPITLERCVLLDGDGRFKTMANQLATHYGRPDWAEGWAKSLEVTKWKENYVSGFFDVNRQMHIDDWWMLLSPLRDGEIGINLVHVTSAHEPLETQNFIDLLTRINEGIRAAKVMSQIPYSSTNEVVRWANRLIQQVMSNLPKA